MRRLLAGIALIVSSFAWVMPSGYAVGATHDSVKGTAEHLGADAPYPVIEVRIHARSRPDGTDARGHVVVNNVLPIASYRGRVTCLRVRGDQATIGIEIVRSTDPALVGQGELWNVVDGIDQPDGIAGYPLTSAPPARCPLLSFSVPVISGDYLFQTAAA
ncbi:MAG: hypothetical protein M3O29_02750 [Actinomycetota bacterium]|nr:hypothetical protein [Actinomycetota bacterium]